MVLKRTRGSTVYLKSALKEALGGRNVSSLSCSFSGEGASGQRERGQRERGPRDRGEGVSS